MSIRDHVGPRLVALIGGPHAGDTPAVDILTTEVTNEATGAVYKRDEAGRYFFSGYEGQTGLPIHKLHAQHFLIGFHERQIQSAQTRMLEAARDLETAEKALRDYLESQGLTEEPR